MFKYIRVENLKMKRTNVRKGILVLPLLLAVLIYLIAPWHVNYNGYNWWYTIVMPIMGGVIGISFGAKDKKNFKYKGLDKYNLDYTKIWGGKIIVAVGYLAIANMSMFIVLEILERILGGQVEDISIVIGIVSMTVSLICSMWLIPFSMIVYEFFGRTVTYITIFLGAVGGLMIAMRNYWWICPFSWYSKVQTPILGLLPNGLVAEDGHSMLDLKGVPISILLALMGFGMFTIVLLRVMKRRVENE